MTTESVDLIVFQHIADSQSDISGGVDKFDLHRMTGLPYRWITQSVFRLEQTKQICRKFNKVGFTYRTFSK